MLLGAFVVSPLSGLLPFLKEKNLVPILGAVVLSFIGICMTPTQPEIENTTRMLPDTSTVDTAESIVSATTDSTTMTTTSVTTTNTTSTTEMTTTTTTDITTTTTTSATTAMDTTSTTEKTTTTTTDITTTTTTATKNVIENDYVLNTNTMKFHRTGCSSCKKISDENREDYHGTREDLIAQGYSPCGICHP